MHGTRRYPTGLRNGGTEYKNKIGVIKKKKLDWIGHHPL